MTLYQCEKIIQTSYLRRRWTNLEEEKKIYYDNHLVNFSSGNGYPTIFINGKNVLLHRYIWEKLNGKIPDGFQIHHKNRNRMDYSIDNLELIEISEHHRKHALENNLGISNKGKSKNHISGFCGEKHPIIASNDVEVIMFESISDAMKTLGVSSGSIYRILQGTRKSAKGWVFRDGK